MIACLGTKEVNKLNCLSYSIPLFPDPSRDHWPVTNSWWGQRSKQRANIDDWFVVTSFQFWFCKCWHWRPACLLVHMPRDCAGLCWPVFSNPLDDEVQVLSLPPPSPGGSLTVTDSGVQRSAQHCDHYLIALPGTLLTLETDNWPGCLMWLMSDLCGCQPSSVCSPLTLLGKLPLFCWKVWKVKNVLFIWTLTN